MKLLQRRRQPRARSRRKLQLESLESRHLLAAAPLLISEFLADNDNALVDGDGNSSDWIEIHNPTATAVNLDGWFLSDDVTLPTKWAFPPTTIAANEYLVIFASGQSDDRYTDAAGSLHTNFRLAKGGEYLGLFYDDPSLGLTVVNEFAPAFPPQYEDVSYGIGISVATDTLIASGDQAHILVPATDNVDSVWTDLEFDDANWQSGPTGIGYENSAADYVDLIQTTVPPGTDSAYVRMDFQVADSAQLDSLTLRVKYDDGFIAYLNGNPTPVARRNAPANPNYLSVATANHPDEDAVSFVDFDLTSRLGLLQDGKNVLAIHALNQASSSDMLLVPELLATRPATGSVVSTGFFAESTPGAENNTGVANPGPVIRDVTENPNLLADGDDLVVTARITQLANSIASVTLNYRVMYGVEVPVAMVDDGSGMDEIAADGVFTAVIPASASQPGDMLRWKVAAVDSASHRSQAPAFLDTTGNGQSPEYYGTVIASSNFETALPIFQWFTQDESAAHSRSGTRAAVFYAGRFYDNVFVRERGGFTNASQSQKFDFNPQYGLYVNETVGTVGEINLNGNGSDPSYLRQSLAFQAHTAAGGASSDSFFTAMLLNGSFDRVGIWIEQVDGNFLERQGYDRDGDLYKLVQRSNLQPALSDTATGLEKKSGNQQDLTTFAALVDGVRLSTQSARQQFLRDHVDIPQVLNYMAVRALQHQADDVRKNIYLYHDTLGDGLWRIYPWDLDWTFNIVGGHDNSDSQRTEHPFFGTSGRPTADGANQWNRLYDVLFETEEIQEMYLRRLRTLMDQFYGGTTDGTTWFADYVNTHFPNLDPHLGSSVTSGKNSLLNSIEDRRHELYDIYTDNIPGYAVVIPNEQPARPQIDFGAIDFDPVTGNQDQEFIELRNTNDFAVDISGWQLAGGISHMFQPGTVIAAGQSLYVSPDVAAFRARPTGPSGNQGLFVQEWNSGHLSNFAEPVNLFTANGERLGTLTYEAQPTPNQLNLRISEIYYHPEASFDQPNIDEQRFEFIELFNVGAETINLAGVYFSDGIDFEFPDEEFLLEPGTLALIVADRQAFTARFGDVSDTGSYHIVGEFQNGSALANNGEKIKLEDADGNTILEINYDDEDPWPVEADGRGASLAPKRLADGHPTHLFYEQASNWFALVPSPGDFVFIDIFDNPGDANRDNVVSFADFLILSANFGETNASFEQGDFDQNGKVDFADFLVLSANFGKQF